MAIIHFAFSRLRPGVSAADKEKIIAEAQAIVAVMSVPGMKRISVGPPLDAARTQGYDFALTADFENIDGFNAYLPNPDHLRLMKLMKNYTDDTELDLLLGKSLLTYQIDTSRQAKL
ncbi:hypothetical protein HGRIS_014538 [Hohenbuehelia grisea]|uniref:Stress-response A/B barrel domain-containing protein n=1 Tax=Hohenbuehelia grisea TaxID=104357 RepID=A0ABR3JTV3_9AGAR